MKSSENPGSGFAQESLDEGEVARELVLKRLRGKTHAVRFDDVHDAHSAAALTALYINNAIPIIK